MRLITQTCLPYHPDNTHLCSLLANAFLALVQHTTNAAQTAIIPHTDLSPLDMPQDTFVYHHSSLPAHLPSTLGYGGIQQRNGGSVWRHTFLIGQLFPL